MGALNIQRGDVVLSAAYTCIPTVLPAVWRGADLWFADCEKEVLGVSQAGFDEALEHMGRLNKTPKVFIPVHVYGQVVDRAVMDMARDRGIPVVEDACEAHGATWWDGSKVGIKGLMACFSFRGDKLITAGGVGGMVVTDDEDLAKGMRELRDMLPRQRSLRYTPSIIGRAHQLGELNAAFGRCQIPVLATIIRMRQQVLEWYSQLLPRSVEGKWHGRRSAAWRFMVMLPPGVDRVRVMDEMDAMGIETLPGFTALNLLSMFSEGEGHCPVAEDIGARGLCLPLHGGMTPSDVNSVCEALKFCVEGKV